MVPENYAMRTRKHETVAVHI